MAENQPNLDQLLDKLETLLKRQDEFSKEINNLRLEINDLKNQEIKYLAKNDDTYETIVANNTDSIIDNEEETFFSPTTIETSYSEDLSYASAGKKSFSTENAPSNKKIDLEKFIGENLINKIGIAITVIGVSIGAKYSIEHELISPLTRIILGYIAGIGLLGFGMKLKLKYENYSAVLVSGSIAILYFITYSAYSFYALFPQLFAFTLMVIFTAFTVIAALNYNKQVIALIGLVGAYAVPFLLSEGSGKVHILFSYIAIINVGILIIAVKKYWKPLYYSSFGLTWLIFFVWYVSEYNMLKYYKLSLVFLSIYFIVFYITFLAYNLQKKEQFKTDSVLLLLSNSFIFFGIGYSILNDHETGKEFLGLFALSNAIIHFFVSALVYRQKLVDKNLIYLITGLVLVFITITFPVQLDGNWVTLLWAGEAALLFWIGRTKHVPVYERISYILMLLAFISIIQDWIRMYNGYLPQDKETKFVPLLNINFLSSILFISAFAFINYLNTVKTSAYSATTQKGLYSILRFSIPVILLVSIYFAFRLEISNYYDQLYNKSTLVINVEGQDYSNYYYNDDIKRFKAIWLINYSLLIGSLLALVNIIKLKNRQLAIANLVYSAITVLVFLIQGLYELSELRLSYLNQDLAEYYQRGIFNIGIRYISYVFIVGTLIAAYFYLLQDFVKLNLKIAFEFIVNIAILWIATSELVSWLDMAELGQSYKLGLSILWGVYSLYLIIFGIWKKKKHLRIGAMILFGVTLLKLFIYDIAHLETIAKTIVFVSLGVLLLIISFLYNKYKHIISNEATQ